MHVLKRNPARVAAALTLAALTSVALPLPFAFAQDTTQGDEDTPPPPSGDTAGGGAMTAAVGQPDISVDIPTIETTDSSLDEDQVRDILAGNFMAHTGDLADLNATSISIPTITVSIKGTGPTNPGEGTITISDVVLDNVVDGVAASAAIGAVDASFGNGTPEESGTFSFGALTLDDLDIGAGLALYGLVDREDDQLHKIYDSFALEGGTFDVGPLSCTVGGVSSGQYSARAPETKYMDVMAAAAGLQSTPGTASPETISMLVDYYAEMFTGIESSPTQFDGFDCDGTDPSTGQAVKVTLAGLDSGGFSGGRYPDLTATGLEIVAGESGTLKLDSFTIKGFDLNGVFAALQAAGGNIDQAWLSAHVRELIPPFEGLAFAGFDLDAPDTTNPSARVKASVENFDLTLDHWVNGIPADIKSTATHVTVPVTASTEMPFPLLAAAGFETVDLGYDLDLSWDEENQTLVLGTAAVRGEDLGEIDLSTTLGNAFAALFDPDPAAAQAAVYNLTLKDLTLAVTDAGLADILWPMFAASSGADVATFKTQMAGMSQALLLGSLGGSSQVTALSTAVGTFLNGGKSLTVTVTANDPNGVGVIDAMAAQSNPTALVENVTIEASAE